MNNYKEMALELNRRIALPFDEKLKITNQTIEESLLVCKNPIVASSFGKDSIALMHLVHKFKKTPVVFTNTGVCFRETIEYKDMIRDSYDLELFELIPEFSFWDIVKKHGYPKSSRNSKTGDKREPYCCKILKYDPMKKFVREHDFDMVYVGLTGDEGRQRRWAFIGKCGAIYEHKAMGIMKCIPMVWWTKNDVYEYYNRMGLPWNPCYKKYGIDRTGCIPCTGHLHWEEQLCRTFPKLYEKIQKDMGQNLITKYM